MKKEIAGKTPVIKASYAPEKVRRGNALKIYIEAEDPEGEMVRIPVVARQAGYGRYPTDWVHLKPEYRNYFKGFLQWNAPGSETPVSEWTEVTLEVSVLDRGGKESDAVTFHFQFVSESIPASHPPAPFHEGDPRLGFLNIPLFEPSLSGGG